MTRRSIAPGGVLAAVSLALAGCTGGILDKQFSARPKAEARERWNALRGRVKLQLAEQHLSAGQLEDAEKALNEALALDGPQPESLLIAGKLRFEQGRLAEARSALASAAAQSEPNPEIEYWSGILAERYGNLDQAAEHYARALALNPHDPAYLTARAEALVALDRTAEALELIESRVADFDDDPAVRLLAARISRMLGLRGPAATHAREALRGHEDDPALCVEAALLLGWAGEYGEVITILAPLVHRELRGGSDAGRDSFDGVLAASAGRVYAAALLNRDRFDEARTVLKAILSRDPNDLLAWSLFARSALAAGDAAEAASALGSLHQRTAPTAETLLLAAYAALRLGQPQAALDSARRALELEPRMVEAHCLTAEAAAALGRSELLNKACAEALALEPRSPAVAALVRRLKPAPSPRPQAAAANRPASLDQPMAEADFEEGP